jgi:molybdopterin biosynthesis enzyme
MGHDFCPACVQMKLGEAVSRKDTERQSWIPVKIVNEQIAQPLEYHGSGHILGLHQADGIIPMEIGVSRIERDTSVCVRLL